MIEIYTALMAFNIHKRALARARGHHKDDDRKRKHKVRRV